MTQLKQRHELIVKMDTLVTERLYGKAWELNLYGMIVITDIGARKLVNMETVLQSTQKKITMRT